MEKDKAFMAEGLNRTASRQPTWNASSFGIIEMQTEQAGSYFLNPNWDNSMDQSDPFESALSSMVSSPAVSNVAGSGENVIMRELIGRLGNICSPVDSLKLNLSMLNLPTLPPFSTDPGFSERAARYSCFSNTSDFGSLNDPLMDSLKLSGKVNGSQSNNNSQMEGNSGSDKKTSRLSRSSSPEKTESGVSKEESSISQQIPDGDSGMKVLNDVNTRKRKSIPREKAKEIPSPEAKVAAENGESNSKRSKQDGNEKESKEPPKDYIHVRARRGQATDSHSLAERVRREKISERMKFLQDLVPGCNKVTGKAVMLDEIINYVQSLQRQVEFLSMKLSTVNPMTDINMEALLSQDMYRSGGSLPHAIYSMDTSGLSSPFGYQPLQGQPLNKAQGFPVDGITDANPQVGSIWEDDLQSIVEMGFGQSQAQSYRSLIASRQVKLEL